MNYLDSFGIFDLLTAAVDIGVASYVFYRLFMLIRGTRAIQMIKGIIVLIAAAFVSRWLGLREVNWLSQRAMEGLVVAVAVVFQPELRRALEQIGRGRLFVQNEADSDESRSRLLDELLKAAERLSRNKLGALIVIERETGLNDIIETGIKIDGLATAELLINIFVKDTPLHDGALVIRGDRIAAAGCFLPLAEAHEIPLELGSRHRAALGITEHSDAVALVVSEETGGVALANAGKLIRHLDPGTMREILSAMVQKA